MIVRIYRGKFQAQGYQVETAADGECALVSLKNSTPDLVLLDLQLPKVNGVEVLKFIRSQPHMKALPVIVFSNAFLGKLVEEAWQAGATTCLTKAKCTPDQLLETLRNALENKLAPPASPKAAVPPLPKAQSLHQDEKSSAIIPASAALTDLAREATAWSASRSNLPTAATTSAETPIIKVRPSPAAHATDTQSQGLIRELFLSACPHILATLRNQVTSLTTEEDTARRQRSLQEMLRTTHSLAGNAGLAGFERIAQIASAVEAFLKEVHEKAQDVNASLLRTVSAAVDSLDHLIDGVADMGGLEPSTSLALVVDEDRVCCRAVCSALAHASVRAVSFNDLDLGLAAVEQNPFDIILMGINMPKPEGLGFLTKMRAVAAKPGTPIVLLTPPEHFEDYALAAAAAHYDVMIKPFLLIEVTVKALTYLSLGHSSAAARTA